MVASVQAPICGCLILLQSQTDRSRFKALALGADFVQLGRPILWGLAHEGEKGVRHVLKSLLAEFDLTTGLSGCQNLADINATLLTRSTK
jgi:lactate 2-monooxygenase